MQIIKINKFIIFKIIIIAKYLMNLFLKFDYMYSILGYKKIISSDNKISNYIQLASIFLIYKKKKNNSFLKIVF